MKKTKQKTLWTILIMVAVVIAAAIGFWQIIENKRTKSQNEQKSKIEEVNAIVKKDFEANYPGTPREVVKMYSRISSCCYNQNLSDEETALLVGKMRELFDEELLASNPEEKHIENLKKDAESYHKAKKSISSYTVDKNSSVKKKTIDGKEYASLRASYLVQEKNSGYTKTYEEFLLRTDKNNHWKIVGWQAVSDSGASEEDE